MVRCHRLEIPQDGHRHTPEEFVARAPFAALTADLLRLLKSV